MSWLAESNALLGIGMKYPLNYVLQWQTPMLITHGMPDYRAPYIQAIVTFTALQRRGIESRLIVFPDESHRIEKPNNSMQWYREVIAWLDRWLKQ